MGGRPNASMSSTSKKREAGQNHGPCDGKISAVAAASGPESRWAGQAGRASEPSGAPYVTSDKAALECFGFVLIFGRLIKELALRKSLSESIEGSRHQTNLRSRLRIGIPIAGGIWRLSEIRCPDSATGKPRPSVAGM